MRPRERKVEEEGVDDAGSLHGEGGVSTSERVWRGKKTRWGELGEEGRGAHHGDREPRRTVRTGNGRRSAELADENEGSYEGGKAARKGEREDRNGDEREAEATETDPPRLCGEDGVGGHPVVEDGI